MMNIFSIFDPMTTSSLPLNWISTILFITLSPHLYWTLPNRWNMTWFNLIKYLISELKIILFDKSYLLNFICIFCMIMIINFMGLFSYIFTSSSHLVMSLSIALPMWLGFMIIGWIFNSKHMFTHQLPVGTPKTLMPFMVMIELISNLIRPIALGVRLMANMIAGHLLLTLLSSNGPMISFFSSILLISTQTILMILEMSVSFIQAYVFTVLLALYSMETK